MNVNKHIYSAERLAAVTTECAHAAPAPKTPAEMQRLFAPEKRYLSYSLCSAQPAEVFGAHRNLELAAALLPGWRVRLYVNESAPKDWLDSLKAKG